MPRYAVSIIETLERVVDVEAESRQQARDIVQEKWDADEIALNDIDFSWVDIITEEYEDDKNENI